MAACQKHLTGKVSNLTGVYDSSVATGDFDDDGDLDLLVTGRSGSAVDSKISKIYINDGSGGFSEDTNNNLIGVDEGSTATEDFDGDGDLDLLVTGFDNDGNIISKIYTNDGLGSFSQDTNNNLTGVSFSSVATGDFDGDNDIDLFLTGNGSRTGKFYTNDGSGSFSEDINANPDGFGNIDGSVTTGDYDKDGDLDLLITGLDDSRIAKIYANDGAGVFSEDINANLTGVTFSSAATGDFDGDSDLDLLITGLDDSGNPTSKVYRNETINIPIVFTEITGSNNPFDGVGADYYNKPSFADLDGDGDLDAFVGNINGNIKYFENTGDSSNPNFSEVTDSNNPFDGMDVIGSAAPTFVDLDSDGDLDASVGNINGNLFYFHNTGDSSNPNFNKVTDINKQPFYGVDVAGNSTPAFADLDADGDLDAFVGNIYGNIFYYRNTGDSINPNFRPVPVTDGNNPFYGVNVGDYATLDFADLDADGDLDAFVGDEDGNINYFENTGDSSNPNFSPVTDSNNPFDGVDVGYDAAPSFADLDADGDLDAFVADYYGNINYFQNVTPAPSYSFTEITGSNNPFDGMDVIGSAAPTFVDLDADGDLDASVGNINGNIFYFENTGDSSNPNFSEVTDIYQQPFYAIDVAGNSTPAFVDLDADGDLEAFVGNVYGDIYYYPNTGSSKYPNFNPVPLPITDGNNPFYGVDVSVVDYAAPSFADLDGDGDFDAFVGDGYGNINYFENTGDSSNPNFSEATPFDDIDVGYFTKPSFADLDGDGDLDAFVGDGYGNIKYFQNVTDSYNEDTIRTNAGGDAYTDISGQSWSQSEGFVGAAT